MDRVKRWRGMSTKSSGETQSAKIGISTTMHESRGGGQAMPRQREKRRSVLVSRMQHTLAGPERGYYGCAVSSGLGRGEKKASTVDTVKR
jgi:hypothetical protein